MLHKVPDRADVIAQFLRERQGFPHQSSNSLPEGVIESFDGAGLARFLADCSMLLAR